jgi:predicted RND superfamily exporter protein
MNRAIRLITQRPGLILCLFGLILVLAVLVTGILKFEQNILGLLPQNNRAFQLLAHTVTVSDDQEKVYILVEGNTVEQTALLAQTRDLIQQLKNIRIADAPGFTSVTMKRAEAVSSAEFTELLDDFLANPALFLNDADHAELKDFFLSPVKLDEEIKRSLALLATPGSSELAAIIAKDPLNLRRFLIEKLHSMQGAMDFADRPEMMSADGRAVIIIATPAKADNPQVHAKNLVGKCRLIFKKFPDLIIGVTGGYVIAAQEEQVMKGDIRACMIGSSIGISLLFLWAYRRFSVLLFIILPLGVGLQLALGVMALCFGRVHIISVAFSAVVLGLGVDFAIHVYDRYGFERFRGADCETATYNAIFKTGTAVFVGGLTSLTAFIVLTFTGSPVLQQIGWLVGLGLFFSLLAILLALPAWLNWLEKRNPARKQKKFPLLGTGTLANTVHAYPKSLVALSILLVLFSLPGLKNIQFERSLEALHPEGLEALAVRQSIFGHFRKGITGAFVSFVADNPQEFWQKSREIDADLQKMKDNKKIAGFASLTSVSSPRTFHLDMRARENIQTVLNRYHLQISSFPGLKALFDQQESRPEPQEAAALTSFKLHQRFFMEDKGEYIGITWVNALSDQVVTDMNNLWKNDDIMVVTLDMALATLMDSARINMYKTVSAAFLLVLVILLVFFRNMTKVMLAMLPMLLGVIVTTGVMGSLGISFNPVNFIILPILIGIGLDDGIHIVDRYRETQDIQKTLISTGRSILLTSLTTCLGFGSLALAKYHVLADMGLLTIVGVLSCFFFSAVLLPALFALRESS